MRRKTVLAICSDFDDTMVRGNTAAMLVRHYLVSNPHHEPLTRRLWRSMKLAIPSLRRKRFEEYYAVLRRIPAAQRHHVLRDVQMKRRWIRAVKDLRMRHKARRVRLTILSRNCVDIIHDWIMQNSDAFADIRVEVTAIIANGPMHDEHVDMVRKRADLKHVDYVGFGQMFEKEKRAFVDKHTIYIGDSEEELLRPLTREFVRI